MDVGPFQRPRTAPRVLLERAAAHPSRARYCFGVPGRHRTVSWAAHARAVRQAAAALIDAGMEPGDRAIVYAPNSVAWMEAALAIQAAGGVLVPVYASSSAAQAGAIAKHSGARFVFAGSDAVVENIAAAWPEYAAAEAVIRLDDATAPTGIPAARVHTWTGWSQPGASTLYPTADDFEARVPGDPLDAMALLLYTSGTTGDPKGVPLTHRNLAANSADWLGCMAPVLDEHMVDSLWLPFSHVFGYGEACLGNLLGWTSWLSEPARVIDGLPDVRPSVFMSVPAYWEKLARNSLAESEADRRRDALLRATGGNLRLCLSGGAGLDVSIKEHYAAAGIVIIEGYGLTETSPTLTLNRPDDYRFDTVGKPLPSVELRLENDGEILARGPNVFSGYYRDPAATAAAFTADGWFRTGDLGRMTEDGFLQITGRKKEILVTAGGKNVSPAAIESHFANEPLIEHVVVYGDGKKYLVAGVWPSPLGRSVVPEALAAAIQQRVRAVNAQVAACETIKAFGVFDEPLTSEAGLLTASLKLRRGAVYTRFRDRFEALYSTNAASPVARRSA